MKDNNKTICQTEMMHKNKNVRKKDIKIIHTKIRIQMIISLSQFLFSANFIKRKILVNDKSNMNIKENK